jgi:RNA polymerase sigma factor (sigma-70 family)
MYVVFFLLFPSLYKKGRVITMQILSSHLARRLIRSFLQNETSALLFHHAVAEPTIQNKQRVEERFQTFYEEIRCISYLSGLIHYHAIAYDKRIRAQTVGCPLRLHAPIGEEDAGILLDLIADPEGEYMYNDVFNSLEELSEEKPLYYALRLLTPKERRILEWGYLYNFSDTEIAEKLGVSQQTVSRTRNKALDKLRMSVKEEQPFCQSTIQNQA